MKSYLLFPTLVIVLALTFLDPFQLFMPGVIGKAVLGLLVLATVLYGTVLFKEKPRDEREVSIRARAHQASYLVAVCGLVAIIAFYLLTKGHVYPETIILLVLVITTKTAVHWYGENKL